MVSSTGSGNTPKKATSSLSDLLGKDNENKDSKNTPVENSSPVNNDKNKSDDSSDKNVDDKSPDKNETSDNDKQKTPTNEEANKEQKKNTVIGLTDKDSIKKDDNDTNETSGLSDSVVHLTSTSKTPDELSTESPDETAERYKIANKVTDEDIKNPRVQVYADTVVKQVPSGTHLHPDVAKDLHNYGIADRTTDSAQVKRTITETYDFAPDAEVNDKF